RPHSKPERPGSANPEGDRSARAEQTCPTDGSERPVSCNAAYPRAYARTRSCGDRAPLDRAPSCAPAGATEFYIDGRHDFSETFVHENKNSINSHPLERALLWAFACSAGSSPAARRRLSEFHHSRRAESPF